MRLSNEAGAHGSEAAHLERPAADWVGERPPSGGLPLYLEVLRSRIWFIALIVGVSIATVALFLTTTEREYKGEADLLVTPIPRTNTDLFGFGLVSESGDPTRDVETFARLITTPAVAERVRARLGLEETAGSLLKHVSAEPVAQSSIVTITAKASSPDGAASIANAFGEAAIAERTARLNTVLDSVIPRLKNQLAQQPPTDAAEKEALAARLRDLENLRLQGDPTLHFETRAVPRADAVAPRPVLSFAAAFVASLVLGIGIVLGSHLLDTRIGREEELRRYRIPILARIPLEERHKGLGRRGPLTPADLTTGTIEAFRRLGSSLAARTDGRRKQTIFITGAAPSDGKTTTSINLAASLATMNERVVLIEADSRRPSLTRALGLAPARGVTAVVTGQSTLAGALQQADGLTPGLRVLSQEPGDLSAPMHVSGKAADALVRDGEQLADWLLFDGPALNYGPDALPLAKRADSVVLVVRLRKTRASELEELAELLVQQRITPDGFIVLGGRPQPAYH
jgi:tyrosine-protein kinase